MPELQQSDKPLAPMYVSFSTFETFVKWLHDMDDVPSQIDRSLWSTKFSGATGLQLMTGLRVLKLLDGQRPTPELIALAKADDDNRKQLLADVLREAYGSGFCNSLATMTPQMVRDQLRELGATDATHKRAMSFFINAAKDVGFSIHPAVTKQVRRRPLGAGAKRRLKPKTSTKEASETGDRPAGDVGASSQSFEALKFRYLEMLMEKAEELGDDDLFDRIERLFGFQTGESAMPEEESTTRLDVAETTR